MHDPQEPYMIDLKRILRYVQGTLYFGLQFYSSSTTALIAYSGWVSDTTLLRSSVEAEYRGVTNAVAEMAWLRNLLLPKYVLTGAIGKTGVVDTRRSWLGHVGEGRQRSIPGDSHLDHLAAGVVGAVQSGTISSEGFRSVANTVGGIPVYANRKRSRDSVPVCDNANGNDCSSSKRRVLSGGHDNQCLTTPNIDFTLAGGSLPNARIEVSGITLYGNQKRSRDTTLTCHNATESDCSSSKRQYVGADFDNRCLVAPSTDAILAGGSLPNAENSSGVHMLSENNRVHESAASLDSSRKRTRGAVSRPSTSYVGSGSSSTRRRSSSGCRNLNTPNATSTLHSSGAHSTNTGVDENCTCPPLEYKYIGKCEHSCEHCGARFWYEERIKDTRRRARPAYHRCCMAGRVVLRTYQIYPEYVQMLLRDRHFMENIRAYNQMFSMTSLGARVDDSINIGRGPYVFKISGQLYHWLGSLSEGDPPRFLQLYIYDTKNEVDNRMSHFGGDNSELRRDIVEGLIELLDNHNALVQLFRTAREKLLDSEVPPFKVKLFSVVGAHEYELPTGDMLGAIVYEPGPDTDMDFDIVIEQRIGQPQRVSKLHPSYMALQFPLLFVYGEDGYSKDMKMRQVPGTSSDEDRRLTMKAYYSYMLHDRINSFNYLSKTGRLFQQYMVTAFCAVEQNRIDFIREHQNDIRNEYLSGIYDAIRRGDSDGSDCGGRLILPQSFTGSPRYMYAHYLDALAICRVHGNPSYFITFTCNVKWPEITEYMDDFPGVTTTDRADIVDRVFEMKIHQFVKYLRDVKPFGKIIAIVYTVEFQKRGLPHCHTLIWVDADSRIQNQEDIDKYISAELPSKQTDPEGHRVVAEFMIHGPCGEVKLLLR
ncbi:DNA helicase [Tanacetum coccineum]